MKYIIICLLFLSCANDRVPEKLNNDNFEATITKKSESDVRVLLQSNDKTIASEGLKKQFLEHSSGYWGNSIILCLTDDNGAESYEILKSLIDNLQVREDFNEIINFIDEDNLTPLYMASVNQNLDNIKILLAAGATINTNLDNKHNPILKLASTGNLDGLKLFSSHQLIKFKSLLIDNAKSHHQEVVNYLEQL